MLMRKLLILCCLLTMLVIPVYAHDAEAHVSDIEKLVSGIGALIFVLGMLSVLFKKKPEEPEEDK